MSIRTITMHLPGRRFLLRRNATRLFTTAAARNFPPTGIDGGKPVGGSKDKHITNSGDHDLPDPSSGSHNSNNGNVPGTNGVPVIKVTAPPGGGAAKFGSGAPKVGPKK